MYFAFVTLALTLNLWPLLCCQMVFKRWVSHTEEIDVLVNFNLFLLVKLMKRQRVYLRIKNLDFYTTKMPCFGKQLDFLVKLHWNFLLKRIFLAHVIMNKLHCCFLVFFLFINKANPKKPAHCVENLCTFKWVLCNFFHIHIYKYI